MATLSVKWTYGHLKPSRSQTMRLIWLKFYLKTHYCILITCAKNQDFRLRMKLCLKSIKTPLWDFLLNFSLILPYNMKLVILMKLY